MNITWSDFKAHFLDLPAFEKYSFRSKKQVTAIKLSDDGTRVAFGGLSNEVYLNYLEPHMQKFNTKVHLALDNKMVVSSLALTTKNGSVTDLFVGTNLVGERATIYYYRILLENNKGPYEIAAARLHESWREDRQKAGIQQKLERLHPKLAEMKILNLPAGNQRAQIIMEYPESEAFFRDVERRNANPRWKELDTQEYLEWFDSSVDSPHHNMCREKLDANGKATGKYEVDIENPYEYLPRKWQQSNLESARECVDLLKKYMETHDPKDENEVEFFYAPKIHDQWLNRQRGSDGKIKKWVIDEGLDVAYSDLSEVEKNKDKIVISVCRKVLEEAINTTAKFYYRGNVTSIALSENGRYLAVGGDWMDPRTEESALYRTAIFNVSNFGTDSSPIYMEYPERIFQVQGPIHSIFLANEVDYYVSIYTGEGQRLRLWLPGDRIQRHKKSQNMPLNKMPSFMESLRRHANDRPAFTDPGHRPIDGGPLLSRTAELIVLVAEVVETRRSITPTPTLDVRLLPDVNADELDSESIPRVTLTEDAEAIQFLKIVPVKESMATYTIVRVKLREGPNTFRRGDRLRLYLQRNLFTINRKEVKYTLAIGSHSNKVNLYSFAGELCEQAAAQLHEAWRSRRRRELNLKGESIPQPRWKRITKTEFEVWNANIPDGKLQQMYRYAPGERGPDISWFQKHNPNLDNLREMCDDPERETNCSHWIDIDQPYFYLPLRWQAENRVAAIDCVKLICEVQREGTSRMFDIEFLSSRVHEHWVARQDRDSEGKLSAWVLEQGLEKPYEYLPEVEKQKDRDVVEIVTGVKKMLLFMAIDLPPKQQAAIILFDILKRESRRVERCFPFASTDSAAMTRTTDKFGLIHVMPSSEFRSWIDSLPLDFRHFVTKNEANPGTETGLFWKEIEGSQTNFVIDMMDVCWLANFEHVPPKVRICYHIKL